LQKPFQSHIKLKPHGFVIATGLHKLLSKTATHVFECLRDAPGTKPYDVPNAMTVVRTSSGN
jgi:hypothetical protein